MSGRTDPAAVRLRGRWPCVRSSSPSNTHPPSPPSPSPHRDGAAWRSSRSTTTALARAHRTLWDADVTVDFAHPELELSRYRLVVAPDLFLLSDGAAENLRRYVAGGGTLLVQHASGYVDECLHARLGGYPATPLRGVPGIRVEEYRPLRRSERITLSDGTQAPPGASPCAPRAPRRSPPPTPATAPWSPGCSTRPEWAPRCRACPRRSRPSPDAPRTDAAGAS
ncbi:beta-galactosidase trimerization domain-containing protein [Streptomyces dysideae]|uniref:beta-galactosidase trimerization domain-containing protein n=1 Tax=Streptomyces dysideae TaxID=909626 RepID=UPI001F3E03C5|nr:beta-galactosidase trimerization domain-containing protein [Streptomyces dysideae]